ncbi:CPBP family intramembrane metalloprotease [Myroides sp. JBRI-B21084]|uniref:CPBP family intramembrane glutamic endopeptidase n=1 Tax=Myroides sp. JBRI-B21084 TaxID=3119977 RepID=UPI0026E352C1|nr:CPBP family intramembrane glutamic endopeptidase [Paenimyroides cloacae]WKW45993.1 CPBP family intramembrane metalloprotease [Paenimyroides cloacae]
MFKSLKNKKENWILFVAPILYVIGTLLTITLQVETEVNINLSRIITAIILAPFIEEFTFRSFFIKKFRIISIVLLVFTIAFFKNHIFNTSLLIVLLTFIAAQYYKNKFWYLKVIIILNSLLFSTVHLSLNEIFDSNYIGLFFTRFSLGLFLIYIVLNFNIWKAIGLHLVINSIMVGLMIFMSYYLVKSNNHKFTIHSKNSIIKWQPKFNIKQKTVIYKYSRDTLFIYNTTLNHINKKFNSNCIETQVDLPFVYYDISIIQSDKNYTNIPCLVNKDVNYRLFDSY